MMNSPYFAGPHPPRRLALTDDPVARARSSRPARRIALDMRRRSDRYHGPPR